MVEYYSALEGGGLYSTFFCSGGLQRILFISVSDVWKSKDYRDVEETALGFSMFYYILASQNMPSIDVKEEVTSKHDSYSSPCITYYNISCNAYLFALYGMCT